MEWICQRGCRLWLVGLVGLVSPRYWRRTGRCAASPQPQAVPEAGHPTCFSWLVGHTICLWNSKKGTGVEKLERMLSHVVAEQVPLSNQNPQLETATVMLQLSL